MYTPVKGIYVPDLMVSKQNVIIFIIIGLLLTYTLGVHTVPCPICGTRSSRRSLESIVAITRERH